MDTLYYSNYCKHCQKIKHFIVQSNIVDKINSICIDKRTKDSKTGQWVIHLDNGKQMLLPPNVHSVPSLLIKSNYHVISGDEIIRHFEPAVQSLVQKAVGEGGEPSGFGWMNGTSDQYTFYSDGMAQNKTNYVDANHNVPPIYAEPDTYRPNKVAADITVEQLQETRNEKLTASFEPHSI
jgi:hypothetical protein